MSSHHVKNLCVSPRLSRLQFKDHLLSPSSLSWSITALFFLEPWMYFPPNLLASNIMLIAARGTFCKLKSRLFSTNPLRMDSHCSWEKDENSQHCLWALHGPEHPGLCRHSPWRNLLDCSSLPSASESSSHCPPSGMFFPPSFFSCCALFKFQDFSWNFAFLGTFSRFQRG